MEQSLETSQASYEIQPRVFYEDFRNFVLYVQDVRSGTGAANWRQVFMADVSDPDHPAASPPPPRPPWPTTPRQELLMRLRDGSRHEIVAGQPQQYNISTFTTTDLPLALSQQSDVHLGRMDTAIYALPMSVLWERIHGPDGKRFLIELAQALRLSGRLPGADAGGRSAGRGLAARRQELRLRLHHSAGFHLLLSLLHRNRTRPPEQALRLPCRVVGQPALCRVWPLPALADGQRRAAFWMRSPVGPARSKKSQSAAQPNNGRSASAACSTGFSRAPQRTTDPRRFPAHSRRVRDTRVPQHILPGAGRLCHAHAGLHLL